MDGVDFESELRLRGLDSRVSAGIALLLASGDAAGTALDVDLLKYEKTLSIMLLYINSVSDCPLHIFFQDIIIRTAPFPASFFVYAPGFLRHSCSGSITTNITAISSFAG